MIVYSIVITAILMASVVCLGYEHILRVKAEDGRKEVECDLFEANREIVSYQIEKANRDGVEAGRATDTLYRNFLEQFDAHQQVTVMLQRDDSRYYAAKH